MSDKKINPTVVLIFSLLLNILLVILFIVTLTFTRKISKVENKMDFYISLMEQNLNSTKQILLIAKDSNSKILEICDNSLDRINHREIYSIDNSRLVDDKDIQKVESILDKLKEETE